MIAVVSRFQLEEDASMVAKALDGSRTVVLDRGFTFEAEVIGAATRREALQAVLVKVQQELDG